MTDALRIPGKRIIHEEFLVMVGKSRDEWKEEAMCVEGGVEGLEERAELGAEGSTAWRGQRSRQCEQWPLREADSMKCAQPRTSVLCTAGARRPRAICTTRARHPGAIFSSPDRLRDLYRP